MVPATEGSVISVGRRIDQGLEGVFADGDRIAVLKFVFDDALAVDDEAVGAVEVKDFPDAGCEVDADELAMLTRGMRWPRRRILRSAALPMWMSAAPEEVLVGLGFQSTGGRG